MASKDTSTHTTKLKSTLDDIQKRFSCGRDELCIWRNSLCYRYSAITNNELSVEINDYDINDSVLGGIPLLVPLPPPSELSKTVIRIYCEKAKSITLTLYFTAQATGTLLCQGRDCVRWDSDECEIIKHHVATFMDSKNAEQLTVSLLEAPVTFIESFSGTIAMKPLPPDQIFSYSTSREICPSSPSDFHSLLSSEISCQACPAQNIVLLPPTPLVTSRSPDDKDPESLMKGPTSAEKRTPAHPKTKKHRRRTLCFTPNPKRNQAALTPSLRGKLESLEASLEALAEAQRETEDSTISLINDSKCTTKNELRTFVSGKVESLNNTIHKLNEKIASLEKATAVLSKENHSLKTQLGTLQSEIKKTRAPPVIPTRDSYSMTDVQIAGLVNAAEEQSSTCSSTDNSHTLSSKVVSSQSEIPNTLTTTYRITAGEQETCCYSIPTQNPFDPLLNTEQEKAATAEMNQTEGTDSHTPVDTTQRRHRQENAEKSKDNIPKLSPKEILGNISIPQRASLLLIGDSVIRHINPRRFATHSESLYKVCVPGVTTRDLCAWVHSLPIMRSVKAVTLHVGISDCPAGQISQKNWYELIALLKKVFPNASLSFSSIIPANGRHSLNNAIAPSNRNLFKVCQDTHVTYIDNEHTFTAPSGAPRLVLYQDLTHPSKQGTVRLAGNLAQGFGIWEHDNISQNQQNGANSYRERYGNETGQFSGGCGHNNEHTRFRYPPPAAGNCPPPSSSHHFPPLPPPQTERTPPVLYQQPIDRKDTHETPAHRDPIHIPPAFHQQPYPPQHPLQPSFDRQGTPETDANRLPPIPVQQPARQSDSQLNPYALQLFNMIASQLMTQQPMFSNHRHQQPSPIPRTLFQPC